MNERKIAAPLNIYSIYSRLQPRFRAARMRLFVETMRPTAATTILDVGGNFYDWAALPVAPPITIVNVDAIPAAWAMPANFTYRVGDARALDFPDGHFDIAYANSVIEHLCTPEDQRRMAAEMMRVARRVFVQTPNRWFPIEPHFLAPFVHWLPRGAQPPLLRWCSLRAWLRRGDNVALAPLIDEVRLLGAREFAALFPGCEILRERCLGWTKSLVAVRR